MTVASDCQSTQPWPVQVKHCSFAADCQLTGKETSFTNAAKGTFNLQRYVGTPYLQCLSLRTTRGPFPVHNSSFHNLLHVPQLWALDISCHAKFDPGSELQLGHILARLAHLQVSSTGGHTFVL